MPEKHCFIHTLFEMYLSKAAEKHKYSFLGIFSGLLSTGSENNEEQMIKHENKTLK